MTQTNTVLRSLFTYAIVLPVALVIGYLIADSHATRLGYWFVVGVIVISLASPLLLKWHFPLLFLSWNATAVVFFLPGRPQLWLVMALLSLGIAVVQRSLLREMRFISAPSVVLPLFFILVVVLVTGQVTGGFGVRVFGSEKIGGRSYFMILAGAAGLLAMMAYRIPPHKALLYIGLFFLGALSNFVGSMLSYVPQKLWYIFLIFPVDAMGFLPPASGPTDLDERITRFYGLTLAAMGVFFYVLARHGVRGVLERGKYHRILILLGAALLAAGGGFRGFFILLVLTFLFLFYYEGLFRTKYGVGLLAVSLLGVALLVPLASRLPLSIQRTISFLPFPVDAVARENAQKSNEWRIGMWQELIPEARDYFWKGKGLEVSGVDLELTDELAKRGFISSQRVAILTGSYHNGPLSVLIGFGIWGFIGWMWFLVASIRVLYSNYLNGEEYLKKINTFLLAYFLARMVFFFLIFGDFRTDFATFTGIVGFALALNGGINKIMREHTLVKPLTLQRFQHTLKPVPVLPRRDDRVDQDAAR